MTQLADSFWNIRTAPEIERVGDYELGQEKPTLIAPIPAPNRMALAVLNRGFIQKGATVMIAHGNGAFEVRKIRAIESGNLLIFDSSLNRDPRPGRSVVRIVGKKNTYVNQKHTELYHKALKQKYGGIWHDVAKLRASSERAAVTVDRQLLESV